MAGPRQKKKLRSSRSRVKTGVSGRTKTGKKKVNFLGNDIIKKNWDNKLTLTQNYERLGLSVRLNAPTGGMEKKKNAKDALATEDALRISRGVKPGKFVPGEVQVERDPETGAILRIISGDAADDTGMSRRANPLNDPLNELDDDDSGNSDEDMEVEDASASTATAQNDVVKQLEAQAAAEAQDLARTHKPRKQSAREEEWIKNLVERHGDNFAAMVRDRQLNPRQQSEGDIRRRVKKWQAAHG